MIPNQIRNHTEKAVERSLNQSDEMAQLSDYSKKFIIPLAPDLSGDILPDLAFTQKVPIHFLKKYAMVPLAGDAKLAYTENRADPGGNPAPECLIAINNPLDFQQIDDLVRLMGVSRYKLVLSTKEAILSVINKAYDQSRASAEQIVQNMEEDGLALIGEIEETADLLDDTSDAPIIKLVNHIISQSAKARASDIHFEPYQNSMKVRYRVDGILYDMLSPPKSIQASLISRIKVMAKLNIAEKRLPQDGRIEVRIGSQTIDIRVSTIPTAFGERLVLRLLSKKESLFHMGEIGLDESELKTLENLIHSPNGIILVTGPTGSGKTTSLYAILSELNRPDVNIITIEDPIEYQINGISQIQVNPKIELTFARGLRSIVRQDPDVILVGEIRDKETADIAVQSALTGHLVFSTLHTNDSASAITRLVDIGVEPFLISSSVIAVIAQRLVRKLCTHCRERFTPREEVLETIGIGKKQAETASFYRAKGCDRCLHTGYRGRIGLFEIMPMDDNLKGIILKTFDSNLIQKEARKAGMQTLRLSGVRKIVEGITTIEEVIRVTQK